MIDRPEVSLGSRRATHGTVLVDQACTACDACRAGAGLWCTAPVAEGRVLSPELPADSVSAVADALLAGAALAAAPVGGAVLVLGPPAGPTALLAELVAPGRVIVAAEPGEARARLAAEPTGRAAVIVAGPDARTAVRAVRRGGHVCVTDPAAVLPSVTELVQREVTLVPPRDVAGPAARVGPDLWAALAAA